MRTGGGLRLLVALAGIVTVVVCWIPAGEAAPPSQRERCPGTRKAVVFYRAATWGWEARRDAGRTPTTNAETAVSCPYAAERAFHGYGGHRGRGFTPWPNTARACNLL